MHHLSLRPARRHQPISLRRGLAAYRGRRVLAGKIWGKRVLSELAVEGNRRLRSVRGRPTAPEWELRRLVPASRRSWQTLTRLGSQLGLSPAQLAALLIERGLAELTSEAAVTRT